MALIDPETIASYTAAGFWGTRTLAQVVAEHAAAQPDRPAVISEHERCSWAEYEARADRLADALAGLELAPTSPVAVLLPDGPAVHIAYLATEKAGLTAVGIGPRAGDQEIAHLLTRTGATTLVMHPEHRGRTAEALRADLAAQGAPVVHSVLVDPPPAGAAGLVVHGPRASVAPPPTPPSLRGHRGLGPNDLFLLNSTSGTTGLPKCVTQFQNRWFYFHSLAAASAALRPDDVFMSVVPAPFGFGLWTAHFTPAILGAPVVVLERFSPDAMAEQIERHRVTVLACVSTQFVMLLNDPEARARDLTSLRVMFTGGEAVPEARAAEFEDETGARVLQFYGSNETGVLSGTTLGDDRHHRLTTAGRIVSDMRVRLLDDDGADITEPGVPGRPACRGPATCAGYFDDPEANRELFTPDGWMLMGDICTIDADGYLRVVGRTSDFIIRGGKNISAVAVEQEVAHHPAVQLAAAVAMPDEVFGERVCVFVEIVPGAELTLESLADFLKGRGVTPEWIPERLEIVDAMPRASGEKIAKGQLRDRLAVSGRGATATASQPR